MRVDVGVGALALALLEIELWRYWEHLVTRVSDFVALRMGQWDCGQAYESVYYYRFGHLSIMLFYFKHQFITCCMTAQAALAERLSGVERRSHDAILPMQLSALFTFNRKGCGIHTLSLAYEMLYCIVLTRAHACLGFLQESHQWPWRFKRTGEVNKL